MHIRGLALYHYFISMGKIIGLLNEYTKQSYDDYSFFKYIEPTHSFYISDDGYESYIPEETILSKRFGFISWLVENDKIDTRKIDEDRLETIQYSEKERVTICDWLLMLLSIQDEPMNFLIPLLK